MTAGYYLTGMSTPDHFNRFYNNHTVNDYSRTVRGSNFKNVNFMNNNFNVADFT
jgi:hypothetical protein